MQIRAINLPPRPPFFSLSLLLLPPPPTHTHTFTLPLYFPWVMKFVWPLFSHSLCHKLTVNGPNRAALPCSFSTPELNINAA